MSFALFKKTALLDEASILWMFDSFEWAMENFSADVFYQETILVNPSNAHFPGNESSAEAMATLIFEKVKHYAGLQHWPFQLVADELVESIDVPNIVIPGALRGSAGTSLVEQPSQRFVVPSNLVLLRDPEVLIATYAHALSHYLGSKANQAPPGGIENWPHVTELLSVYLGFGLIMANTAHTAKIRSCGSCSGPSVERSNFLSQYDITYALAIFCFLKNISANEAQRHLKKTLRPFFKKAHKDIGGRSSQLEVLFRHRNKLSLSN
ncbi:MAG: hypothetical protein ACC707_19410 [Thiohalomonadales bacterium]